MSDLEYIYMFLNGSEWEDAVLLIDNNIAIEKSISYPNNRVEIFKKNERGFFKPTYEFYRNGKLCSNNNSDCETE
jgi:hypothetical protein